MKYLKMLVITLIAALGCCASVVASSASAQAGPQWGYCKLGGSHPLYKDPDCTEDVQTGAKYELALLEGSETLLLLARGLGSQLLLATGASTNDILCTALEGHGWLLGGNPGLGQGVITYSSCTVPNTTGCDVSTGGGPLGTITTNQLEAELVYLTKPDAVALNPDESGTLFKPLGNTGNFVSIELHQLTGGSCPVNGLIAVKGNVLAKNDEPLAKVLLHTILAKNPALKEYFEGASGAEKKIKRLEIGAFEATYFGNVSLDVTELNGPNVAWWICP
jgi:hypothetical protein